MNILEITKFNERYHVRFGKREGYYLSLDEASNDYCLIRDLKDYVLEFFRLFSTKKLTIAGCGDFWWAEIETEEGDLIEEEGSNPTKAAAALLLSIKDRDNT